MAAVSFPLAHRLPRVPLLSRWIAGAGALALAVSATSTALADTTVTVDGSLSDWPTDGFSYLDGDADPPQYWLNIEQILVTNDNTSGSDGNLYVAVVFEGEFIPRRGSNDTDVIIALDIDGDGVIGGPNDRIVELTEGIVMDGDGNELLTIDPAVNADNVVEAAIPYEVLGLTNGNDSFGMVVQSSGVSNRDDSAPNVGEVNNGLITYDGTGGDDIEPLSVTLAALGARYDTRGVTVAWSTGVERGNLGFHVYRLTSWNQWVQITDALVPGLGDSGLGRDYELIDPNGQPGFRYYVADLDASGLYTWHGPVVAARAARLDRPVRRILAGTLAPKNPRPRRSASRRGAASVDAKAVGARRELQFAVHSAGLNRLSWDALGAAGWDVRRLRHGVALERAGGPVSTIVDEHGLWFVGAPAPDRYAAYEVLTASSRPGAVMPEAQVESECIEPLAEVSAHLTAEEQRLYYVKSPSDDPLYWTTAVTGVETRLELRVPDPSGGPAELELHLAGLGADHAAALELNGIELGEVAWAGSHLASVSVAVPEGVLRGGQNLLGVELLPVAGFDYAFIDRVELDYPRLPQVDNGALEFAAEAGRCVRVGGFGQADPWLVDVTNPLEPVRLLGQRSAPAADGTWSSQFVDVRPATFAEDDTALRRYLVADSDWKPPEPEWLRVRSDADLSARKLSVDYLVVSHPDFAPAATRLAAHHASRGLRTKVVTTDQVYDQFSHGRPTPDAIRQLLATVRERWRVAPRYVTLMGSAAVDATAELAGSPPDTLPAPFWVTLSHGYEAAADAWYVEDDQGIPQAAVGRLPVRTAEEAEAVVDKLVAGQKQLDDPIGKLLFVADSYSPEGTTDSFELAADALRSACELGPPQAELWLKAESASPSAELLERVRDGVDLLSFHGHGFLSGWSSSPILIDSVQACAYDNEPPFLLLSWTCFDGGFVGPWGESLAWSFVRNPNGGALLATASTTLADPAALSQLGTQLLCRLTSGESPTVGDALLGAQRALAADASAELRDLLQTYALLGDPATPNPWAR